MTTIPRRYTFTPRDVWLKTKEVVRHFPDRTNPSRGQALARYYTARLGGGSYECCCLFGHVLKGMGVHPEDVTEGQSIGDVVIQLTGVDRSASPYLFALDSVQLVADQGETWTAALLAATSAWSTIELA